MNREMKLDARVKVLGIIGCSLFAATAGAYVTPKIGGGQEWGLPMIMPEVTFDGWSIGVLNEDGGTWATLNWSEAPILRPLVPPDEFDPNRPWRVLIGKAYNFQYGWDSALLFEYPPWGTAIWVKVLRQSSVLDSYDKDMGYIPIFGTPYEDGNRSPDTWMWDLYMRHNTYAVADTHYGRLFADYKLYIGDEETGEEVVDSNGNPLYGSANVTFRWLRPCPYILQGDIDSDCVVDFNDYIVLANYWLSTTCSYVDRCEESDLDGDLAVSMPDLVLLTDKWLVDCTQTPFNPACVPR